jgi:hypothetical protein
VYLSRRLKQSSVGSKRTSDGRLFKASMYVISTARAVYVFNTAKIKCGFDWLFFDASVGNESFNYHHI